MARFYDPDKRTTPLFPGGSSEPPSTRVAGRHRFRKPILLGGEGEEEGVYGFGADLQCPFCGGKFDFILVEFDNSAENSSLAWGELDLADFNVDLLRCPDCGHRDLEPL